MQLVNCDVSLASDRNHVVRKLGITVAEVDVLRAVHGSDAVRGIQPTRTVSVADEKILADLRRRYRRRMPALPGEGSKCIVDAVFTGPRPKLPKTLADIGVHRMDNDADDDDNADDPLATPSTGGKTRARRSS